MDGVRRPKFEPPAELAVARRAFRAAPSNKTAGHYLYLSNTYDQPVALSDVSAEVAFWLRHDKLMILPDDMR